MLLLDYSIMKSIWVKCRLRFASHISPRRLPRKHTVPVEGIMEHRPVAIAVSEGGIDLNSVRWLIVKVQDHSLAFRGLQPGIGDMWIESGKIFVKRPGDHELVAEKIITLYKYTGSSTIGHYRGIIIITVIQGTTGIIKYYHTRF